MPKVDENRTLKIGLPVFAPFGFQESGKCNVPEVLRACCIYIVFSAVLQNCYVTEGTKKCNISVRNCEVRSGCERDTCSAP